jgi:predicted heme/steroid binding protein
MFVVEICGGTFDVNDRRKVTVVATIWKEGIHVECVTSGSELCDLMRAPASGGAAIVESNTAQLGSDANFED